MDTTTSTPDTETETTPKPAIARIRENFGELFRRSGGTVKR